MVIVNLSNRLSKAVAIAKQMTHLPLKLLKLLKLLKIARVRTKCKSLLKTIPRRRRTKLARRKTKSMRVEMVRPWKKAEIR